MISSRSSVVLVLVIQLVTRPALAVGIPSDEARPRVGILRVGDGHTDREERAFSLLEKRVQRWMENAPSAQLTIRTLPLSLGTEHLRLESDRARLEVLAKETVAGPGVLRELRELRRNLAAVSRYSPTVQNALIAEARATWAQGDRSRAGLLLKRAALLHPDGLLPDFGDGKRDWDEEAAEPDALEERAKAIASEVKRPCEVRFRGAEDGETIVNGYAFGLRRDFQLPAGGRYHFQIVSAGHEPWETRLTCDRQSRREVNVQFRPSLARTVAPSIELAKITEGQNLSSLFLIQAAAERFRLYLFTPGSRLEEIPLREPLRVAEVLDNPGAGLPVARDTLDGLLQRHRLAQMSLPAMADAPGEISGDFGGSEPQWYNDWRVWAVAGGIVTGVIVGYLATRGPEVRTNGGPSGIRIQLD